jgi:hypothetical protein
MFFTLADPQLLQQAKFSEMFLLRNQLDLHLVLAVVESHDQVQ